MPSINEDVELEDYFRRFELRFRNDKSDEEWETFKNQYHGFFDKPMTNPAGKTKEEHFARIKDFE